MNRRVSLARYLLLLAALNLSHPIMALAQVGIGDLSGASATARGGSPRLFSDIASDVVNVKGVIPPAKGDAKVVNDAAITGGAAILTSASALFAPADVNKVVTLAGAGSTYKLRGLIVVAPGGTVANPHRPADVITLAGGTGTEPTGTIQTVGLTVAAVNAGGSAYPISSSFDVYVTGVGGTCTIPMVANVATNGSGVVTSVNSITNKGNCSGTLTLTGATTTNYLTTTTGSGLTLNLGTGVSTITPTSVGSMTALAANATAQGASSGSGLSATFNAFFSADPLQTTISGYTNATTVTLAANAAMTTSAQWMAFGTDDSTAVQAAVTQACAQGNGVNGGGGKVFFPWSLYIVNNINTPCPITFEGVGSQANGTPHGLPWMMGGSFLIHTSLTNPAINLQNNGTTQLASGSQLQHLGMFEVHPADYAGWAPIPYPFFIAATGSEQEDYTLHDLMAAPVYQLFNYANGGKFKIDQVHGHILGTGILATNIGDVSRITDVHFWPYWLYTANTTLWTKSFADAWRSDSETMWFDDILTFSMRSGLHFIGSSHSDFEIKCGTCDFDTSLHGVWIDNLQHQMTIHFNTLYQWADTLTGAGNANIYINNPQFNVGVDISIDHWESNYGQPLRVEDGSSNIYARIVASRLANYNNGNDGTPAIFIANKNNAINSGVINQIEFTSLPDLAPTNPGPLFNTNTNAVIIQSPMHRDVQIFTSSGTWTKPPWCAVMSVCYTEVYAIAAGPGGGQGAQGTLGTGLSGGASGGGAACLRRVIPTSTLSATVAVTVASTGGVGGSTSVSGAGQAGSAGSDTIFGSFFTAFTGGFGGGGQVSASSIGGMAGGMFSDGTGASASANNPFGLTGGGSGTAGINSPFGTQNAAGSGSSITAGGSGNASPCIAGSSSGGPLTVGSAAIAGPQGGAVPGHTVVNGGAIASSGTAGAGGNAVGNGDLFPSTTGAAGGGGNTGGTGGTGGGGQAGAYGCGGAGGGAGTVAGGPGGTGCGGYLAAVTTGN